MFLRVLKGQGRVDEVLDWILDGRTPLLVTCVGDPRPIARAGPTDAGVKHYHQVGSLNDALRAVDAGVDGLIVEGAESGGLRGVRSPTCSRCCSRSVPGSTSRSSRPAGSPTATAWPARSRSGPRAC